MGLLDLPNELLVMIAGHIRTAEDGKVWRLISVACYEAAYKESDFWKKCGAARRIFRHHHNRHRVLDTITAIGSVAGSADGNRLGRGEQSRRLSIKNCRPATWTVAAMKVGCVSEWAPTCPRTFYNMDIAKTDANPSHKTNCWRVSRHGDIVIEIEVTFYGTLTELYLTVGGDRLWTWYLGVGYGLSSKNMWTPRTIRRDLPTPLSLMGIAFHEVTIDAEFAAPSPEMYIKTDELTQIDLPYTRWAVRQRYVFCDFEMRDLLQHTRFRDGKLLYSDGLGIIRKCDFPAHPDREWCKGPRLGTDGTEIQCNCCWQQRNGSTRIVCYPSLHDVDWKNMPGPIIRCSTKQ